jgi:hypothetical protein
MALAQALIATVKRMVEINRVERFSGAKRFKNRVEKVGIISALGAALAFLAVQRGRLEF